MKGDNLFTVTLWRMNNFAYLTDEENNEKEILKFPASQNVWSAEPVFKPNSLGSRPMFFLI